MFVARFTGLAGEVSVRVRTALGDGMVELEPAGPASAQGRPLQTRLREPLPAAAGLLLVRPTGVHLCALHTQEHHLAGTIADVAFRGRGYEHAMTCPGTGG